MTGSRAKAIQYKVNSLLSLHEFDLSMNGSLPQADMLCVLRYEPDINPQMDKEVKEGEGHEDGGKEDAAGQEKGRVKNTQGTKATGPDTTGRLPRNYRKMASVGGLVLPVEQQNYCTTGTTGQLPDNHRKSPLLEVLQ